VIPTKAYLATKGRRLDPLLLRYLESLLTAPFTFFEVLACDPGTGMTLRDVMTQEEHEVTERGASQGMQLGDLLQVASEDAVRRGLDKNGSWPSGVTVALLSHSTCSESLISRPRSPSRLSWLVRKGGGIGRR
jgi:hypothetical protein